MPMFGTWFCQLISFRCYFPQSSKRQPGNTGLLCSIITQILWEVLSQNTMILSLHFTDKKLVLHQKVIHLKNYWSMHLTEWYIVDFCLNGKSTELLGNISLFFKHMKIIRKSFLTMINIQVCCNTKGLTYFYLKCYVLLVWMVLWTHYYYFKIYYSITFIEKLQLPQVNTAHVMTPYLSYLSLS